MFKTPDVSILKMAKHTFMSGNFNSQITKLEEELFDAVEVGDVAGVIQLITNNEDLNLNIEDNLGRTPLNLATANEHEEVKYAIFTDTSL